MANFTFETGTQAQASAFASGDTLYFTNALPGDIAVSYNGASGTTVDTIGLSYGGKTLTFGADALTENGTAVEATYISLNSGSYAELDIARPSTTSTVSVYADHNTDAPDVASIAYGFSTSASGEDTSFTFNLYGNSTHIVHAGNGGDTVDGSSESTGSDYIYGGTGADTIMTGSGNNHVYGNVLNTVAGSADGADTIILGSGTNYANGNAGDDIIFGGISNNRIFGGGDNDSIAITGAGVNSVNGNKGDDYIVGGGVAANDSHFNNSSAIAATTGNNVIHGGQGDDTIVGGTGQDQLFGDIGDDHLIANGGATHLTVMTGGDGSDTFDFTAGNVNTITIGGTAFYQEITDFSASADHLMLAGGIGTTSGSVEATQTNFSSVAEAHAVADSLLGQNGVEVVATQVGTSTYLFYQQGESNDAIIKLDNVTATSFDNTPSSGHVFG